jgi:hypothetical protein
MTPATMYMNGGFGAMNGILDKTTRTPLYPNAEKNLSYLINLWGYSLEETGPRLL